MKVSRSALVVMYMVQLRKILIRENPLEDKDVCLFGEGAMTLKRHSGLAKADHSLAKAQHTAGIML
jgi:hypothetical protein